jgi:L-fuconolactonase
MVTLARCENVFVKLGGIGMTLLGGTWHHRPELTTSDALAETWGPRIRWVIEQFGAERCMFESNFPVDKNAASHVVLWNAFKQMVADASPDEKRSPLRDTAVGFYRLS